MFKKPSFTIAFFVWMAMVSFLSLHSFSEDELPGLEIPNLDKLVHAIFYCGAVVLGCLFVRERTSGGIGSSRVLWIMCLTAVGYGIIIEVLQGVITADRDGNAYDALANLVGALMGAGVIRLLFSARSRLNWKQ